MNLQVAKLDALAKSYKERKHREFSIVLVCFSMFPRLLAFFLELLG